MKTGSRLCSESNKRLNIRVMVLLIEHVSNFAGCWVPIFMICVALFCSVNMFYVLFALGAGASVISGGCRSPLWGELPHARHCHFQPTPTHPPQGIAGPKEREFRKGKNTRQKLGKIVWKTALWTPRWEKEGE